MKHRYCLYLETSLWKRLGDLANLHARRLSYRFLNRACRGHDVLISSLVMDELERTPDPVERRVIFRRLRSSYRILLSVQGKAVAVARQLQAEGGFSDKMLADLTHVGYAVLGRADALVTWDVRTLARDKVRLATVTLCRREGFPVPLIGTPQEVARWLKLTI